MKKDLKKAFTTEALRKIIDVYKKETNKEKVDKLTTTSANEISVFYGALKDAIDNANTKNKHTIKPSTKDLVLTCNNYQIEKMYDVLISSLTALGKDDKFYLNQKQNLSELSVLVIKEEDLNVIFDYVNKNLEKYNDIYKPYAQSLAVELKFKINMNGNIDIKENNKIDQILINRTSESSGKVKKEFEIIKKSLGITVNKEGVYGKHHDSLYTEQDNDVKKYNSYILKKSDLNKIVKYIKINKVFVDAYSDRHHYIRLEKVLEEPLKGVLKQNKINNGNENKVQLSNTQFNNFISKAADKCELKTKGVENKKLNINNNPKLKNN